MKNIQNRSIIPRGYMLQGALFVFDAFVFNFSYFIAILLRFSDSDSYAKQGVEYIALFKRFAPWYTIAGLLIFVIFRMYSSVWRYAGFNDVKRIGVANLCTWVGYVLGSLVIVERMPVSVYILGAGIQILMTAGVRVAPRYAAEIMSGFRVKSEDRNSIPMMIVGLCENTRIIQNRIKEDRNGMLVPACIIDYSYQYTGSSFNGIPVYTGIETLDGIDAISYCIEKYDIQVVVIADPNLPLEYYKIVKFLCGKNGIELREFMLYSSDSSGEVRSDSILRVTEGRIKMIKGEKESIYPNGKEAIDSLDSDSIVEKIVIENDILTLYLK